MRNWIIAGVCWLVVACLSSQAAGQQAAHLIEDPSFEVLKG